MLIKSNGFMLRERTRPEGVDASRFYSELSTLNSGLSFSLIDKRSRLGHIFSMFTFPRKFSRLYPTLLILATLGACQTLPSVAPPGKPAPAPIETAPVDALREREEQLKFEEAARPFRELDDPARSFEMLDAFLAMHPDSSYADEAVLEQARIRASQGQWEEARKLLENLLEDYPSASAREAALIELAQTCKDAERWKDCVEASRNALALDLSPEERFRALLIGADCKSRGRDRLEGAADAIEAYHLAIDDNGRGKAIWALEKIAVNLDDRQILRILEGSDGSEPYGILTMELLERHVERGEEEAALSAYADIVLLYSESLPPERKERAYQLMQERFFAREGIIGVILPLSGPHSFFGQKALQGIQAAFGFQSFFPDHATRNDFTLMVKDSRGDPLEAAQAVRDLAQMDQALVIIGPLFSQTTRSAAAAAEEMGIPLISLSPDPEVPALGRNIFRRSLLDSQQVQALAGMACGRLGIRKFAALYPDDPYGREMTAAFQSEVAKHGGQVVDSRSFEAGQTDFGAQIRAMVHLDRELTSEELALKRAGGELELAPIIDFEALFIPADYRTVGMLAPQLAFYDVDKVLLLGTDGWNSPWLVEFGEHHVEGALFTAGFPPPQGNGASREMMERYWLSFLEDPLMVSVQAYDAALLVKTGIESGEAGDRAGLKKFLLELRDFPSAEGPLTTDPEGDILQEPFLLTVKKGEIILYRMDGN